MILSRTFFFLFFCFALAPIANSQNLNLNFVEVYEQSTVLQQESLNLDTNKNPSLFQLFAKEEWGVSDLKIIDSLISSNTSSPFQIRGLYTYIGGEAYNDFDTDAKLRHFQEAYVFFEKSEDLEGMFFSLNQIFNSKITIANIDENNQDLEKSYDELQQLASKSSFVPVQLALKESYLRKVLKLNQDCSPQSLAAISQLAEKQVKQYPDLARNLFTAIGVVHQRMQNFEEALDYKRKALGLANPQKKDYPSYFSNIGGSHFYNRDFDSAKIYLRKAYYKAPDDPKTVYQTSFKSSTAFNLSVTYKILNTLDSAYYFSQESNRYSNLLSNLKLKENSLYADKKFELQKSELKLAKKDLELTKERQHKSLVIWGLAASIILIFILVFAYKKTQRLKNEATVLKEKREQLLQIINHDLGEPLQVFADSAIIIPKLLAQNNFDDLEHVQYSMAETIVSLQSGLKNLRAWNQQLSNPNTMTYEPVNVKEEIASIINAYANIAETKKLDIKLTCKEAVIVEISPFYLGNLLRNSIYNAVKHSQIGQSVQVNVSFEGEQILKITCENNIKINATQEVQDLIEHFNNKEDLSYTTTGLGLQLIDEALGQLDAKAEASLEKEVFKVTFLLPLRDELGSL